MCGIAGIYNLDGEPPDSQLLGAMARAIAHRGPDAERFLVDETAGLGLAHRHLRIIDLSDDANQPMQNEDGTLHLIFNGEIYNYIEMRPVLEAKGHRFRSHSDSETILHAYEEWGPECLHKLNGMFAFALWDSRKRTLFLARDRVGVKPLYYTRVGTSLLFASEIKALLQHPGVEAKPYLPAISGYMSAMYTVGERTWFDGISRLLPGHYLLATPTGIVVRRWWDLPSIEDAPGRRPESYYIDKTRQLLEDSIRLRLRSDVPLGSHLSGGLDSSAIVGLISRGMTEHGERLRTFSGAFAEGPAYDERAYVRAVVERYRTDHHETVPTAGDLARLFERIVWHMDEPAAGPGVLLQWSVCELTRASGVTVINGGQGGDEAWAGYFGYIPSYFRTLAGQARRHPSLAPQLARDASLMVRRPALRKEIARALRTRRRGRLQVMAANGPWAGDLFLEGRHPPHSEPLDEHTREALRVRSPLARAMYYDLKWYLPALLQVEDRTSMAFSLESRAPLLDYRLLEHAASVPSALRMKGLTMKYVLRQAVRDVVPPRVLRRADKMGMPTPIAPWFKGELARWLREQVEGSEAVKAGVLSGRYIGEALREHSAGAADRSLDLWKVLNVAAWWEMFVSGRGTATAARRPETARVASSEYTR